MSTVAGLLGAAASAASSTNKRLDNLEAAAGRMAAAIVALETTVADLGKSLTATVEALGKSTTAELTKQAGRLAALETADAALGKRIGAAEGSLVTAAAGLEAQAKQAGALRADVDTNRARADTSDAAIRWALRALITIIHPPHDGPPDPPTPPAKAASSAIPTAAAEEATERGHVLIGLTIDSLGGRLTAEEFAAGPPL